MVFTKEKQSEVLEKILPLIGQLLSLVERGSDRYEDKLNNFSNELITIIDRSLSKFSPNIRKNLQELNKILSKKEWDDVRTVYTKLTEENKKLKS